MTDHLSIALAQLNPTVGDIDGNAALVSAARKAAAQSQAAKNGSDPVQEAIERAKARKAEQEPNP